MHFSQTKTRWPTLNQKGEKHFFFQLSYLWTAQISRGRIASVQTLCIHVQQDRWLCEKQTLVTSNLSFSDQHVSYFDLLWSSILSKNNTCMTGQANTKIDPML